MLKLFMGSSQHFAYPRVGEGALRVEVPTDALEVVPAQVPRRQLGRVQERALAPVRAAAELAQGRLDLAEGGLEGHAAEHVHGDEGRRALVGGREQGVVAGTEAQ